jgi:hypothetical protein
MSCPTLWRARAVIMTLAIVVSVLATAGIATAAPPPVQKLPAGAFVPPENCGCHAAFQETWKQSMHAKALSDPIYQAKLAQGEKETGGKLGNFCNTCHAPVAVMSGEIQGTDRSKTSPQSASAISCDFCHQVDGARLQPPRDASYKMVIDGMKHGPLVDAQAPHPWRSAPFFKSAEFCGNCHNVTHPFNGTHLESSYSEWKRSPYAAKGIVCQDCHMTPGPGVTKPNPGQACVTGPQREMIYTMTWAGGNVALGDSARAEANLKAAAKLEVTGTRDAETSQATILATVTNVGAGHDLPTGLTEVREMWLDLKAVDESGKVVGSVRRDFGTVLKDSRGNHPVEMWAATGVYSDDRIPATRSKTTTLTVPVPKEGALTVKAALYYRSASEALGKEAGVEIPTTTMASVQTRVFGSEQAAAAAREKSAAATGAPAAGGLWLWILGLGLAAIAIGLVAFVFSRRRA